MKDKSKSVLAKLKNKSNETGIAFQQLLLLLCQEEFLRRLSKTNYSEKFILKGGLFIYILSGFDSRGTVDMDFLIRNHSNNIEVVAKAINSILGVETQNSFINFEVIGTQKIAIEKTYPGISINMIGKIGNTRTPVNIDIGVGDVIVPKSEIRIMKTQLEEFEEVNVNTYSLESSMAEKIDAIIQRYELTSRMKDFYDIWYISRNFEFEGPILLKAVKNTLTNRGTIIEYDTIERIKNLKNNEIFYRRWNMYTKKMKISLEFEECVKVIENLYKTLFECILDDKKFEKHWYSSDCCWK